MTRKTRCLVFGVGVLIACVFSLIFSRPAQAVDESLTLETYYPAPYGIYSELTTTNSTYLATGGGNVGIGNTNPGSYGGKEAKLDVGDSSESGYAAVDDIYLKTPMNGNARWASKTGILSSSCRWTGPMCLTGGGRQISCPADTVVTAIRTGQGCGGDTHAIELECCSLE